MLQFEGKFESTDKDESVSKGSRKEEGVGAFTLSRNEIVSKVRSVK